MKFTIERAKLLKTLSHVQSIVEKRNTIPVLSNVRIEAMEDGISFKATDMDTEITEIVDAKLRKPAQPRLRHICCTILSASFPTVRTSS